MPDRAFPTGTLTIHDCDKAILELLAAVTAETTDRERAFMEIDRWLDTRLKLDPAREAAA